MALSKQDRQGARTPASLEQKYRLDGVLPQLKASGELSSEEIQRLSDALKEITQIVSGRLDGLSNGLGTVQNGLSSLEHFSTSAGQRLDRTDDALREQSGSISRLETRLGQALNDLSQTNGAIMQELSTQRESLGALATALADLRGAVSGLEERLTALEK